jgi:hypothetical protein
MFRLKLDKVLLEIDLRPLLRFVVALILILHT